MAFSTIPKPIMGSVLAVQETTMSKSCRRVGKSDKRSDSVARPCSDSWLVSSWPRSRVRFATATNLGLRAAKCVAHKLIISPAPINNTF